MSKIVDKIPIRKNAFMTSNNDDPAFKANMTELSTAILDKLYNETIKKERDTIKAELQTITTELQTITTELRTKNLEFETKRMLPLVYVPDKLYRPYYEELILLNPNIDEYYDRHEADEGDDSHHHVYYRPPKPEHWTLKSNIFAEVNKPHVT